MKNRFVLWIIASASVLAATLAGCGHRNTYFDPNMDFGGIRTVAVMPLQNLSGEKDAAERVRDVLMTRLLATGGLYVIPKGEVARGISRARIQDPAALSADEVQRLAGIIKADAIFTGMLREYGEVRSGSAQANMISMSMQLLEAQSGRVVWSADTTQGGIGMSERLLGGGGRPLNEITLKAISDLINKLFA